MKLIACPHCDRQYDVSLHQEGGRVRCVCGEELTVRHLDPKEPRALRCPGCGAPFSAGSHHCGYCRVEIDPLQMSFTSLCPHCHARMTEDAHFCMDCGREIAPQVLLPIPSGKNCPRCSGALVSRRIETTTLIECSGCMGLWLAPQTFEEICLRSRKRAPLAAGLVTLTSGQATERPAFKYLPCLVCDDFMVPRNFGGSSGIVLDVCGKHGVWLDAGELAGIVRFLETRSARDEGAHTPQRGDSGPARLDFPIERAPGGFLAASGLEFLVETLVDLFRSH